MTTREDNGKKPRAKRRAARVKRPDTARSGPIRAGAFLDPAAAKPPPTLSPKAHKELKLDEGLFNEAVATAVRTANQVLSDTVGQSRVAAEQFRQGNYNMRDVPVDVEILGKRMIKLTRELSDTALNILEQLLGQVSQTPRGLPAGARGSVPPFPTGKVAGGSRAEGSAPPTNPGPPPQGVSFGPAPPSTVPAPVSPLQPPDHSLDLTVQFTGGARAKALPSPLWKPSRPTLPSQLAITPMMPMQGNAAPITGVRFETDLSGKLTATVAIPSGQPSGVYAGMIMAATAEAPLGVLTIEVVA